MSKDCCDPITNTTHKKWRIDPFLGGIVMFTIVALVVVVFAGSKTGSKAEVTTDEQVELSIESSTHDWGEIDINGGIVSKSFMIENTSDATLKLYDVITSCMCTTAQLITSDESSKKFGMHEKASSIFEVNPNNKVELLVEFDPAFHGPSGVGPINRTVTINTNDPKNPQLSFELSANVSEK